MRLPGLLLALLLLAPLLPAAPATHADPWGPGHLGFVRSEYNFGLVFVNNSVVPVPHPVRMEGSIHAPASGAGPFPLVLLMHGRHATCDAGPQFIGAGVACPETRYSWEVTSYKGFDHVAEHLASRGYVVVSVNANDINDRDWVDDYGMLARAELALKTLDRFAQANQTRLAPPFTALHGKRDLSRIGLMGHSRGGEGMARAVVVNEARTDGPRHAIRALFALAPIDHYRELPRDVAFATLLPYCDGDVDDLQGHLMYDDLRYLGDAGDKHLILAMGANHNWYNEVWADDDDSGGSDPYCGAAGSGRMGAADQRNHGLVFIAGFFRHALGGEPAMADLFSGAAPVPSAACPAAEATCEARFHVSRHAQARRLLEDAAEGAVSPVNDAGGASTFTGFSVVSSCEPASCPTQPNVAAARQLTLGWTGSATWRLDLPAAAADARGFRELAFRGAVDYGDARNAPGQSQDLRVVLTDGSGASASAAVADHSRALFSPPGAAERKVTLNQVRVPLSAFVGVDLGDVRRVELVFDRTPSGLVQVADLLFQ